MAFPIIHAVFDENGLPQGFYPEPIYSRESAPPDAIEIPYLAYLEFLEFQGLRKWTGSRVEPYLAEPPNEPVPDLTAAEHALISENLAIRQGIVNAVSNWAALESQLAMLLGAIVNQQGGQLGAAIYYSPSATETRLGIVNDAIVLTCSVFDGGARVLKSWERISRAISRCKRTRNIIVHGNIATMNVGGRNWVRLTQPLFDPNARNTDLAQAKKKLDAASIR